MAIGAGLNFATKSLKSPLSDFATRLDSFGSGMVAQADKDELLKQEKERLAIQDARQASQDARQSRMDLLATPGTPEYEAAMKAKAELKYETDQMNPNYELNQQALKAAVVGTPEWKAAMDAKNKMEQNDPKYALEMKLKNAQYRKLINGINASNNSKVSGANYVNTLNSIPTTTQVVDEKAMATYNNDKARFTAILNANQNAFDKLQDPVEKAKAGKVVEEYKKKLSGLQMPATTSKPLSKKEYISAVNNMQKNMQFGSQDAYNKFQKTIKTKLDMLYPNKEGMTPYQNYQATKDVKAAQDKEQTAISLANSAFGVDEVKEMIKKDPSLTPTALTKLAEKKMNKKYSSTSITDAVSGIVTDGDTNSNSNISSYKKELEEILKTKFKGNKADMVQELKGYYDEQGTGTFKNWGGNSPIGDALDRFVSKHK